MKKASKIYLFIIFFLMYAPILVMIFFSFNKGDSTGVFTGFSFKWYAELFHDRHTIGSLYNTLIVAVLSAVIATVLGTAAAVGISYMHRWQKKAVSAVTNIPLMNPDIVTGVSLMLLFVFVGVLFKNTSTLGFVTVLIAHITFNLPYVIFSVLPMLKASDRYLSEAAQDLGCTPIKAFFKAVLPSVVPGIITGFIMSFTLSIDDFVISYFVSGPGFQTLPLRIYSMTKKRVRPDINALSTILFVVVLVLLILINVRQNRNEKKLKTNSASGK